MYQRQGKSAYKKDLKNIIALCDHLGNPQDQLRSIHIAGTNGKGSCSHIIGSCLVASGLKVGIYTSPHYKDFRERIKIDGKYISKKWVSNFITKHKATIEQIKPSFFEITVAMAFTYFHEEGVDVAVIETGLGGRLDSTNILKPLLTLITNISLDHQNMLGNTLVEIAHEKAGIIKSKTPIIIGEYQREVAPIFEGTAQKRSANLSYASALYQVDQKGSKVIVQDQEDNPLFTFKTHLRGPYTVKNIVSSIAILTEWNKLSNTKINAITVKKGFKLLKSKINYMGRWQEIQKKPLTIADSAHNVAGLSTAFSHLAIMKYKKLHIVLGFVNDKDLDQVLKLLPTDASYYFAKANIPRGQDAKLLQSKADNYNLKGRSYKTVKKAYKSAQKASSKKDLIFVCGSIFVTAEVL